MPDRILRYQISAAETTSSTQQPSWVTRAKMKIRRTSSSRRLSGMIIIQDRRTAAHRVREPGRGRQSPAVMPAAIRSSTPSTKLTDRSQSPQPF